MKADTNIWMCPLDTYEISSNLSEELLKEPALGQFLKCHRIVLHPALMTVLLAELALRERYYY